MFARLIKQKVHNVINSETDSTFAMAGFELQNSDIRPQVDAALSAEEKAESILEQMTLEEKAEMLGGTAHLGIKGNSRLNLPEVWCSDASAGVRCFKRATAFPAPIAMAATWNRAQIETVGKTIGQECRAKGVSILLGPGVNIYRIPTCGRNFEYLGEDPFLASELVVPYIQGVQSMGVITTVKHFACNNSDYDRHRMNSIVDERTLREIYFPAFKAAVQKGGSLSVMSAYNPVNGEFASENRTLLTEVLREEWGFKGFVISDWISVYSTENSLKAGLDLEMPKGAYLNPKRIQKLIARGRLTETDIDQPVRNLLTAFFKAGIYERSLKDPRYPEYSEDHSNQSLETAREAIVLLKNETRLLPLQRESLSRIVVVGGMAEDTTTCGGGSCCIRSHDKISILDGIRESAGDRIEIEFIKAAKGRLSAEDRQQIQDADVVIISVGFTNLDESEAYDKAWELPDQQGGLIQALSALNPRIIVTLTTGTGVETESWLSGVPALLHCFYLGERGGRAVGEVLFGTVNPSGKLPFSMAKQWRDFASSNYYVKNQDKISLLRILGPQGRPGIRKIRDMAYQEKLMVGYRHFDTNKVVPQFPFGFGLSYTEFSFSDLELSTSEMSISDLNSGGQFKVSLSVRNVGEWAGSEVVQLYVSDPVSSLPRPVKELKGFEKVRLEPDQSAMITFVLQKEHFSFFNDQSGAWTAEAGDFNLLIGSSSRAIHLTASLALIDR